MVKEDVKVGVLLANEGYLAIGQIEYARVVSIHKVYGAPWGLGWYIKRQLRKYYCKGVEHE